MVPAGRVEHGAGELVDPRDVGGVHVAEHPDRADEDLDVVVVTVVGGDVPHRGALVPRRGGDAVVEPDVRCERVLVDTVLEVLEDLGLRPVRARPVALDLERVRVERRRHITRTAGIGVVVPRAADARRPLEDGERVDARLEELDPEADPTGPRPDDPDANHSTVMARSGQPTAAFWARASCSGVSSSTTT